MNNRLILRLKDRRFTQSAWIIACIFPFLILVGFVARHGTNVPFMDQWELTYLFEKVAQGNVQFQDLFTQQNEHRILFPRLIFIALAFLTHWNTMYEMYFSIFLVILSYGLIYKISFRQTGKKDVKFWLISLFVSIIITSFVQAQNWLWGFQIAWFLINFCLIFSIFCLTSGFGSVWLKIGLGAIGCFIASFSLANGLMAWLAVTPCVLTLAHESNQLQKRGKIKVILCWAILFISSCLIYFSNYHKPPETPNILFFLKHLDISLTYFLSLLGTPLLSGSSLTWLLGLFVLANFVLFFIRYLLSPYSEFSRLATPWLSMGLFSLLFALITTVGRSGFGVTQAYASRYTTVSILLIIALVQLWRLASLKLPNYQWQCLAASSAFTVLVLLASIKQVSAVQDWQAEREWSQDCLEITESVDTGLDNCLQHLYPKPRIPRERARVLNQIGFRHDPDHLSFVVEPTKSYGFLDPLKGGEQTLLIKKTCLNCAQEITFAGWAILPDERKPASLVLLSYNRNSQPAQETILETVAVRLPSPDVAEAMQSQRYAKARWSSALPIQHLPLGETVLKAWVYDSKGKQFVKLGEANVKVEE